MTTGSGVHLIGSVPLADAATVFRTVAGALGPWLSRIPDGETGERRRWIYFQRLMLERHPAMEPDPTIPPFALRQWDGKLLREMTLLRFRPAIDPDGVTFETGYAAAARASYAIFRALRDAGAIPSGVRFQVCLPTPMASAYMYVSPGARAAYLPAYERALVQALQDIVSGIPAADLAIQWDVCQEVLVCEGFFPDRPASFEAQIAGELARLGQAVPDGVEMGYHLCYGSPADEHLVMPRDTAIMVAIANGFRREAGTTHRLPARAGSEGPHGRRVLPAARRSQGIRRLDPLPGLDPPRRPRRRPRAHPRGAGGDAGLRRVIGVRLGPHRPGARPLAPRESPRRGRASSPSLLSARTECLTR